MAADRAQLSGIGTWSGVLPVRETRARQVLGAPGAEHLEKGETSDSSRTSVGVREI